MKLRSWWGRRGQSMEAEVKWRLILYLVDHYRPSLKKSGPSVYYWKTFSPVLTSVGEGRAFFLSLHMRYQKQKNIHKKICSLCEHKLNFNK